MANDNWYMSLDAKIFTIMKTRLAKKLGSVFPKLFCTSSDSIDADPVFPTIYIHPLQGVETGSDLVNESINAILYTLQVDVTANTTMNDCRNVTMEVMNQLKLLHFSIVGMPVYTTEGNVFRGVIRGRRTIGGDDSLT